MKRRRRWGEGVEEEEKEVEEEHEAPSESVRDEEGF